MDSKTMMHQGMPPPLLRRRVMEESVELNTGRENYKNGYHSRFTVGTELPTRRGWPIQQKSFEINARQEFYPRDRYGSNYPRDWYGSNYGDKDHVAIGNNGSTRNRNRITQRSSTSMTELVPTSMIPYNESNHAAMRRAQRDIGIREMQAVLKHGVRTPGARRNTYMYKYKGKTYILDESKGLGVTCYQNTKEYKYRTISFHQQQDHYRVVKHIRSSKDTWTSHTVLIVDKSGSMRESDVKGSRSRFQGTWGAIADDFVAQRIDTGEAKSHDVVSIILMGDEPSILFENVPTDWILYNSILDLYNGQYRMQMKTGGQIQKKLVEPGGHGNYIPALKLARKMLSSNNSSSCALSLAILTDGRPSDFSGNVDEAAKSIVDTVSQLSSQFGRRFTVATIGMGNSGRKDQFDILRNMVSTCSDYGSTGLFQLPSMNSSSLGAAFSSLASSVTNTQREMTHLDFDGAIGRQRQVRQVQRERASTVPFYTEVVEKKKFDIYMHEKVHRMEYDSDSKSFKKAKLQHPDAKGVAKKIVSFGEGGERLAFQFFEIASDGCTVVGEPLVAKSSRFIERLEDAQENSTDDFGRNNKWNRWRARDDFVRQFCERQYKALKLAEAFNKKLDSIPRLDPVTPRVTFLDCSIYYTDDDSFGEAALLVERKLNGKFMKWNGNNGYVRDPDTPKKMKRGRPGITTIPEDCDVIEINTDDEDTNETDFIFITKSEVAQAFSHFTFHYSGEKMILVDLQGEYDNKKNMFCFTDPVIHYYNKQNPGKRNVYGRTDMGRKGVEKFFDTHVCNALCPLITRGFKDVCHSKDLLDAFTNRRKKKRCA